MPYLTGHEHQDFTDSLVKDLESGIRNITVLTSIIGSYRDSPKDTFDQLNRAF